MSKKDNAVVEETKVVETESKKVPKEIRDAWDSIVLQLKKYRETRERSAEMEVKCMGFLECTSQVYPQLQEENNENK